MKSIKDKRNLYIGAAFVSILVVLGACQALLESRPRGHFLRQSVLEVQLALGGGGQFGRGALVRVRGLAQVPREQVMRVGDVGKAGRELRFALHEAIGGIRRL